jgi:P27 family predicted phage terminase small subunit
VRGRKPTPTCLKLLQGNPGKRAINHNEPMPGGDLAAAPPRWLTKGQKECWRNALKHSPPGLLKCIDSDMLAIWAVAADLHRIAALEVEKDGAIINSKAGVTYQNPYLSIQNKQAEIMLKIGAELGFYPLSRRRVRP